MSHVGLVAPTPSRGSGTPPRAQNIPGICAGGAAAAKGGGDGHSEAAKNLSPHVWPVSSQNLHIYGAKKAFFNQNLQVCQAKKALFHLVCSTQVFTGQAISVPVALSPLRMESLGFGSLRTRSPGLGIPALGCICFTLTPNTGAQQNRATIVPSVRNNRTQPDPLLCLQKKKGFLGWLFHLLLQ